jgi:hypothetical protein
METQRRVVDAKHCAQRAVRKSSFEHHRAPSVGGLSAASSARSVAFSTDLALAPALSVPGGGLRRELKSELPPFRRQTMLHFVQIIHDPRGRDRHLVRPGHYVAHHLVPALATRDCERSDRACCPASWAGSVVEATGRHGLNELRAHRFVTFSYWRDDLPIHRARDLPWQSLGNNFNQGACAQAERAHLRPRA